MNLLTDHPRTVRGPVGRARSERILLLTFLTAACTIARLQDLATVRDYDGFGCVLHNGTVSGRVIYFDTSVEIRNQQYLRARENEIGERFGVQMRHPNPDVVGMTHD